MKNSFLLIMLVVVSTLTLKSQEGKRFNGKTGWLEYLEFQASGEPQKLFVVLGSDGESKEQLLADYKPIALTYNARLEIVTSKTEDIGALINEGFNKGLWLSDSIKSTTMIIYGESCWNLDPTHLNSNSSILINPVYDSVLEKLTFEKEYFIGIVNANKDSSVSAVINALSTSGAWINYSSYADDNSFDQFRVMQEIDWVDSLTLSLNDSLQIAAYRQNLGLMNEVPEIVRQGRQIEIELANYNVGECTIEILDLSSKVVYEKSVYLGRGHHNFIIPTKKLEWGVYSLKIEGAGIKTLNKFMIRG
jgi:hypothetical protein